jgi:hypothetical protein
MKPSAPKSLSIPLAIILSGATAIGGAYVGVARAESALDARMTDAEKHIDLMRQQMNGFVPSPEFALAVADVKRELDEIRGDVKEIRRGMMRK